MADKEVLDLDGIPVRDSRLKPQTSHVLAAESEFTDLLCAAKCRAKPEIKAIRKNAKGNFGPYATLDEVIDAVDAALPKYGLDLSTKTVILGDQEWLVSTLRHVSGQFERSFSILNYNRGKPQEKLSFTTYYRRNDYACLCGIAADSDLDGAGLKGAEPPKVSPAMGLARSALRGARSEQERDTVLAKAAMSVVSKRMTEEQLADLRAEREEMAPIQKVVPEATKEGAGA
jgi:hypothetical protein